MESLLTSLWLIACFEKLTLDTQLNTMASSQLTDRLQEVTTLDFGPDHGWQVIDVDLLSVDSSTLVLFLNELVSDPHYLLERLIMTHNTRFISL